MKKYILIHEEMDLDIHSFDTLAQLERYISDYDIVDYTIALKYRDSYSA